MIQCYILWYLLSYYIEDIVPAAASHRWECMAAVHTPLGLQLTIWDLGPHLTHHGLQLTTCDRGPRLTIFTMTSWAFLTTIEKTRKNTKHLRGVARSIAKPLRKQGKPKNYIRACRDKTLGPGPDCQPCSLRTLRFICDFLVFSMVLRCCWLSILCFFSLFWFSQWFCIFVWKVWN